MNLPAHASRALPGSAPCSIPLTNSRHLLPILFVAVLSSCTSIPDPPGPRVRAKVRASAVRSRFGVILQTGPADLNLVHCSRTGPGKVDGYWLPSREQIARLEDTLPQFLDSLSIHRPRRPLESYFLQYLGFRKGT